MKSPKRLFTFADIPHMTYRYFTKKKNLYQKFENFDLTHKSNDEYWKKFILKISQFLAHRYPLGGLNGLENENQKCSYSFFAWKMWYKHWMIVKYLSLQLK